MSYIGNTSSVQQYAPQIAYFSGDASTVAFTLPVSVVSAAQIIVAVANVIQNPSSAFTVSGTTLTFTSAPPSGTNNIWVQYTTLQTTLVQPAAASVGLTQLSASGTPSSSTYLRGDNTWSAISSISTDLTVNGLTVGKGGGNQSRSTAVGVNALAANTSSNYNTAIGNQAAQYQTGALNVAVGDQAMLGVSGSSTGGWNVAVGQSAMLSLTTGNYNVSVGDSSLLSNATSNNNTAVGYQAGYGVTSASTTYVGYQAGYSSNSNGSSSGFGYQCLYSNTTGYYNIAAGYQAGYSNTTGICNTFLGGPDNATSRAAGVNNTTGSANVAVGAGALSLNATNSNSVAVGYQALYKNVSDNNTAIGYQAGYNTTNGTVCAVGYQALSQGNTAAATAMGHQAGYQSTCDNAAYFGYQAGYNATGGNGAVAIGPKTQFGSASPINEVVLGVNAGGTVTGKGNSSFFVQAGGGGYYNGGNTSSWNTTSDRRIKKNIVDNTDGLNKITAIQVRNFEYRLPEEIDELPPEQAVQKEGVQLGVIAQELQEVLPDCVNEMSTGILTVQTDNLTWHMINAIKELKAMNDELTARITALESK